MSAKTVFISYSHDSASHRERVLGLSERLRGDGIETRLDQYLNGAPDEGWPRWMLDRLDEADFVLVVCTETYYRRFRGHEVPGMGKGADWEGTLITQELYDTRSRTLKFVPVLFDSQDESFIPEPLRKLTYYLLTSESSYNEFYDFLLGQGGVEPGPIGTVRTRERRRGVPLSLDQSSDPELQRDEYLDRIVRRVAAALNKAKPLTMRELVRNLDVLFDRGTFRFEPLKECLTQEWGRRLLPAMETLELLRRFSSFAREQAPESQTFVDLMDAVNGYCVAMGRYLFEEPVKVSELRDYMGTSEFLTRLPKDKEWRPSPAAIDDDTNTRVEGPRIEAIAQMDKLLAEFVKTQQPNHRAVVPVALLVWSEKLAYLLEQEAIAVDAAQKFALRKQIEEARARILELGG